MGFDERKPLATDDMEGVSGTGTVEQPLTQVQREELLFDALRELTIERKVLQDTLKATMVIPERALEERQISPAVRKALRRDTDGSDLTWTVTRDIGEDPLTAEVLLRTQAHLLVLSLMQPGLSVDQNRLLLELSR